MPENTDAKSTEQNNSAAQSTSNSITSSDESQNVSDGKSHGGNGSTTFHLKVYSPFKTYYDADVESLSATNDTGPFDILAKHKNFMTLISPCDLVIRNGAIEEKVPINRGIMHVKSDRVIVFLDI